MTESEAGHIVGIRRLRKLVKRGYVTLENLTLEKLLEARDRYKADRQAARPTKRHSYLEPKTRRMTPRPIPVLNHMIKAWEREPETSYKPIVLETLKEAVEKLTTWFREVEKKSMFRLDYDAFYQMPTMVAAPYNNQRDYNHVTERVQEEDTSDVAIFKARKRGRPRKEETQTPEL